MDRRLFPKTDPRSNESPPHSPSLATKNYSRPSMKWVEVDFVVAYQVETHNKVFAEYVIEVREKNPPKGKPPITYTIIRRYSEAFNLHQQLQKKYKLNFPVFPVKTLFKPTQAEIEKRRLMFSAYFKAILEYPEIQEDPEVNEFFLTKNLIQEQTKQRRVSAKEEDDEDVTLTMKRRHLLRKKSHTVSLKPVFDFAKHVQQLKDAVDPVEGVNGFDREFFFIEERTSLQAQTLNYESAFLPQNMPKNRYTNILPSNLMILSTIAHHHFTVEETRVRLSLINNDPTSDYINANFISGLAPNTEHAYVATQGPLPHTIADFWRMIWELRSVVIVNLTREIEANKIKCARYWPNLGQQEQYGFFTVLNSDENVSADVIVRRFFLMYNKQQRQVIQFQFMDWPDQGVPSSSTTFLNLVEHVSNINTPKTPIVVHCSAGIGRTGTFCVVHSIVELMKIEVQKNPINTPASCNIVDTLLKMRSQRAGLVQTKEQYMFCYSTVLEAIDKLKYNKLFDQLM